MEELIAKYYDPNSLESVINYANLIHDKTLRPHLSPQELELTSEGKGDFGNLLEAAYFKVRNNNESRPDIPESGIEIKSGQVKLVSGSRVVIKERLKISMIDYMGSFDKNNLADSKLWPKLENLLLLLFKKDGHSLRIDETCVYSNLLKWNEDDIKQMSSDWLHIRNKVLSGNANELSEGQTWYLGACTAGANSTTLRNAPMGTRAKVRAFSLKSSYLNFKLGYSPKSNAPKAILSPSVGQTLDDFILTNMQVFFDKPLDKLASMIHRPNLAVTGAKNKISSVARALLEEIAGKHTTDVSTNFEQFEKAGVIERAVTLEKSGSLKESLSFPAIKWTELAQELEWEDSELYSILTSKFFFTVFKKTTEDMPIFIGCFFWTMPTDDMEKMKQVWLDTKDKVIAGEYERFIAITDDCIGHVRPHATKGATYPTPQGQTQKRQSFWLNSSYVKKVVVKELKL